MKKYTIQIVKLGNQRYDYVFDTKSIKRTY